MRRRPGKPSPSGRGLGEGETLWAGNAGLSIPVPIRHSRPSPPSFPAIPTVIPGHPHRHSRESGNPYPGLPTRPYHRHPAIPGHPPPSFRPPYPSFPRKRESTPWLGDTPIPAVATIPAAAHRHSGVGRNPEPRFAASTDIPADSRPGQSPQPPFCERGAFGWRPVGVWGGGDGFGDAGGGRTAVRPYAPTLSGGQRRLIAAHPPNAAAIG